MNVALRLVRFSVRQNRLRGSYGSVGFKLERQELLRWHRPEQLVLDRGLGMRRVRKTKAQDIQVDEKPCNQNVRPKSGMVRLIDKDGVNRGIQPVTLALEKAKSANLDLVQIMPDQPDEEGFAPVCKILSYHKFMYEARQKEKDKRSAAIKARKAADVKEVSIGTSIEANDLKMKLDRAKGFLMKGSPVRISIMFRRSTSLAHLERKPRAMEIIREATEYFSSVGKVQKDSMTEAPNSVKIVFLPSNEEDENTQTN